MLADQGTTGQSHNTSKTQKQALPTLLPPTPSTNKTKSIAPRPTAGAFVAPNPRNIIAHSPSNSEPISAPSPATPTAASQPPSLLTNFGVRKRETEDGEIVGAGPSKAKRARVEVVDVKPTADAAASGSSIASPPKSVTSPNPSVASPNLSFGSPSIVTSSPSLSGVGPSAASQTLLQPRQPSHLQSQPLPLRLPTGARTTTDAGSHGLAAYIDFFSSASAGDLVTAHPSFVTAKAPASQIGQPRAAPVEPGPSLPPGRKATTPVPTVANIYKSNPAGRPKRTNGREMSEQEHRRLFGATGSRKDGDKRSGYSSAPSAPLPPSIPDSGPPSESASIVSKPRTRAPRPAIPKRSPVAPPVSRLPTMMTSPIRATGVSSSSLPPSFSPLRRLLKNAGVKSIEEVLIKGGVMGLKDEMKREDKREREVVDLTSDADEDDAPASGRTDRTPPRTSRPID
ncbi:hypothetical protein RHS01_07512 [Rhizoctonia solani]|uniref:Uncharacterized protein n=1 Tax=Rhizoctonia solani TaxID=456999 RepID=A0A8H7I750_9AGAM|nr:hypothetical protein RHS01_07512 [Rhizoctonia solani]